MLDYSKRKCYGFVKNNSDEFIINEAEASNVKLIFECFLIGMSLSEISKELHSRGIVSPSGKETWSRKVISSTLSNKKYSLYRIISIADFEAVALGKLKRNSSSANEEITSCSGKLDMECIEKNEEISIDYVGGSIVKAGGLMYNKYINLYLNTKKHINMILYILDQEYGKSVLSTRFLSSA